MGIDLKDPLLQADQTYIEAMLTDGILRDMNADVFPGRNGIQIIRCSDGDQGWNLLNAHRKVCRGRDCHHEFAMNGLPISFSPMSPAYDPEDRHDRILFKGILGACGLKDLKESIALYSHWPCGVGLIARLPIWMQMFVVSNGKQLLLDRLASHDHGQMVIVLGMHLDLYYRELHEKLLMNWNRRDWFAWHQKKFPNLLFEQLQAAA